MFGYEDKSQAWYERLAAAQNGITVLMAEVEEVGESIWNLVSEKASGLASFSPFQTTKDRLLESFQGLVATKDSVPSDEKIITAENLAYGVRQMIEFVKKTAPEIQAKVDAMGASVRSQVEASPLQSPETVGWDEFERQMKDRAKGLLPSLSTTTIVAVIAGLVGLVYFIKRR